MTLAHKTRILIPAPSSFSEALSFPFVEVPARGQTTVTCTAQRLFRPRRFVLSADDASRLRVLLMIGSRMAGMHGNEPMPGAIFADRVEGGGDSLALRCSNCGAPPESKAPRCRYCRALYTWRLVETTYGQSGYALDFPMAGPGYQLSATFWNRSAKAIGVDSAFLGEGMSE